MSVETEIENLREDVRGLRAAFDSFTKTFQGDVMSRLATLEQWKLSHQTDDARVEAALIVLQRDALHVSAIPDLIKLTAALKAQNDKQEGSINALKAIGSIIGVLLAIATITQIILVTRGH